MATIVDGVRQRPTYETSGFVVDQEVYLMNVGAGQFFTQGNSWGTQASVGTEGRLVKFTQNSATDYQMLCYCWRTASEPGGYMAEDWRNVFFDSETELFVDRNNQANYYFAVEDNGSTFRLSTSANNPTYGDYADAGLYVGLTKNSSSTALSPFVDKDEAYVDWAVVTKEDFAALSDAIALYEKAQELKEWIDKIEAQNGDASSLKSVYLNEEASMEELEAAIANAQPIYIQALINNAPDKENVDVTTALVNPDFEYGLRRTTDPKGYGGDYGVADGWVVDRNYAGNVTPGPLGNEYDSKMIEAIGRTNHCFESWHCHDFDVYQEAVGLPVGVYEIQVQGYMRCEAAGYTRGDLEGLPNMPIYLYLNKATSQFPDVYSERRNGWDFVTVEDWTRETINGYDYPNSMGAAAQCFAHGMYKKNAYGLIATDKDVLRIGVKGKTDKDAWVIWDNFKLTYRGFKADVVKPVLDEAVEEIKVYEGLVMGKTEYAALKKALDDAAAAIENNDGEAMFKALTDLYAVKDDARISKDIFDEAGVNDDVQSLNDAISATEGKKLSQATLLEAQTLLAAITGNTKYEGTEIEQLKSDVAVAIQNLENSIEAYANLNEAITAAKTAVSQKAMQTLLDETNTLVTAAEEGYNAGSLTTAKADEMTAGLWNKQNAINASATEYAKLATAIANLEAAIADASAETQHVAASTLKKANLRLTASQKVYDEGSVSDADIAARVTAINELITELTRSIELYKQFAAGLADLETALSKQDKVAAAVLANAQQLYTEASASYEAGSTDDDQIEATVNQLKAAITALETSAALYQQLVEALPELEAAVTQKAMQSLLDEATTLLTETMQGYEEATIADADINALITSINGKVTAINTSATEYAKLKAAIERLEAAIEEVGDQATKSTLKKANLRLAATQKLYDNGTIADEDIAARVQSIDELIESLTASIRLRQQYDEAIQNLDVAVSVAQGKVPQALQQQAEALQTTIKTDYENGNVDDENIAAEIEKIENIVAALRTAEISNGWVSSLVQGQTDIDEALLTSTDILRQTETLAEISYLTTSYRSDANGKIASGKDWLEKEKAEKASLDEKVGNAFAALNEYDLTTGDTGLKVINETLASLCQEASEILIASAAAGDDTKGYVDAFIFSSARIVEMKGQYATFCSTADLDFSEVEGLTAYVATEFDADRVVVKMQEVTSVPAGTGVLLVADEAGEYTIDAGDGSADFETNLLVGNERKSEISATTAGKTNFILVATEDGAAFNPTKAGTLAAGKSYLSLAVTAGVKSVAISFEDLATGVRTLRYVDDGADWYDLTGKKLEGRPTQHGIYIRNGKKVTLK